MCIIAVKPAGVAVPSVEILTRLFNKNPDGAGIALATDKGVKIDKGIMTLNDFLTKAKKIPTDSAAIIHCRISTSGGICRELTHPFILSGDINRMRKTQALTQREVVAHNGVFGEFGSKEANNDTTQFIINYLKPLKDLAESAGETVQAERLKPIINKLVSGSRLVILDKTGRFTLYGNGWEENNGVYYSNTGYKEYNYYSTTSTATGSYYSAQAARDSKILKDWGITYFDLYQTYESDLEFKAAVDRLRKKGTHYSLAELYDMFYCGYFDYFDDPEEITPTDDKKDGKK